MAAALPGITKSFVLNPNTPTLLSPARANPKSRLIINNDHSNYIAWAHGTGNLANAQHHQIAPGAFYEFRSKWSGGLPLPEPDWGMFGDNISAIAVSGSPTISFLEL
jgi:hypothetical protein